MVPRAPSEQTVSSAGLHQQLLRETLQVAVHMMIMCIMTVKIILLKNVYVFDQEASTWTCVAVMERS